jgi:5-methylcytosine-specific restriction protein A
MAERSATLPDDGRRGRPLFTVLVGADSLRRILELTNGTELRPAQLADYVEPALFEHVLFESPIKVIGVSKQRTYRDLLRKAILARDRGCQHPGCDAPIDQCEIDHKLPATQGGPTTQTNGRAWCGPHNRARNQPGYHEPDDGDEPPPTEAP